MSEYTPTAQQQGCIDAALRGETFVAEARAGAGKTTIQRPRDGEVLDRDQGLLWEVRFTKQFSETSSSSNVEKLSQGELITLWQQIGALFNLAGMREGLSDEDLARMGSTR